jgi:predicted ATP-dependent protease
LGSDPPLSSRHRVSFDALRWSCPKTWLCNEASSETGSGVLRSQARFRDGLEALLAIHQAGRSHHLELSTPRSQSWAAAVSEFLRARTTESCPVRLVAAAHSHELRGNKAKPGLLAEADGGIIVIDAGALSREAWQACAEALLAQTCRGRDKDGLPVGPARPTRLSAILVGPEPELRRLRERHPEISRIFARRLLADSDLPRDKAGVALLTSILCNEAAHLGILGLGKPALAYLVEESAGGRSRRHRLSTNLDLLHQALAEAGLGARSMVSKPALSAALQNIHSRRDAAEAHARARIGEALLVLNCSGTALGLVNGLMVYGTSRQSYCMPGRISARISAGREGVINLERESKYSGSSFDKGVFQLSAWLRAQFGKRKPLSFAATLVFEQSASKVDGDSATLAEAIALLSALSGIPANQSIAVSGALNQRGEVLPIGSVNLKVEGWWKSCKQAGLSGSQGVLIPTRNVGDLQLTEALVSDIKAGRFHLWAAENIEDSVEVVLGRQAGRARKTGGWTKGSVYDRVARRIALLGSPPKRARAAKKKP